MHAVRSQMMMGYLVWLLPMRSAGAGRHRCLSHPGHRRRTAPECFRRPARARVVGARTPAHARRTDGVCACPGFQGTHHHRHLELGCGIPPLLEPPPHPDKLKGYITFVVFAMMRIITAIFLKDTMAMASQDLEMTVHEKMKQKQELWGQLHPRVSLLHVVRRSWSRLHEAGTCVVHIAYIGHGCRTRQAPGGPEVSAK